MILPTIITDNTVLRIPTGVHHVTAPVTLHGSHIRIVGENGTILRGSMPIPREAFTEVEPGVFAAEVSAPVDGLYVCGKKYTMARYPKYTDSELVFGGYAADCTLPLKTKDWADPTGGYIHAMHACHWGGYSYRIDGKNPDGTLILSGGWQNNRQMGMHEEYRFAENIREEMTLPGEWYFSERESRIYVRPLEKDDLAHVEAVITPVFFVIEDCEDVTIENIAFEQGARTFMETKEPLLQSDWTICRKGAVLIRNSQNCTVTKCAFRDIGSNGVFTDGNCTHVSVLCSHFADIGASAVCFVGRPDAVRSPLFEYNQTQTAAEMDKTPGPKTENYPKHCTVEDCLIQRVGLTEKQATGVEISMAFGVTVKNCTICHTSRAGINISEGTFGGHRIEGCDVFDTVRETGDHGSFNSWGRDRYWNLKDVDNGDCGQFAHLDMLAPNVITRNRFRCDHGWDIDLDDGSSFYQITHNLCLNGGIKLREGFGRVVRNNITVNNTVHLHVWYPNSGDIVENNILFKDYAPIGMPAVWGDSIDHNYLHTPGCTNISPAQSLASMSGQDNDSVCVDCAFRDPTQSDFTPTHPAVTGFEDFPTVFGVRDARLRALADTPKIPVENVSSTETECQMRTISGALLKDITSDGEMSVYGTASHNGALVLSAEGASAARGLQEGDVIITCNDTPIHKVADLAPDTDWESCPLVVLRKQVPTKL